MSFHREIRSRKPTKMAMRITPSAALKAIRPCSAGYHLPKAVTRYSGMNLYRKTKKAKEKTRLRERIQEETSSGLALAASSSLKEALAEKRKALIPNDIACPRVPSPRITGYLN